MHSPVSQADGFADTSPLFVGDTVRVFTGARLPLEHALGVGTIQRVTTARDGSTLYWVSGFFYPKTERELRRASVGAI
jgi:hypothetical protein